MSVVPPAANGDDDAHRPRRIGLRPCDARHGRKRGGAGGQMQKFAVLGKLKRFLPHLTLKWIDEELPYVRADERQRYIQGFRLAGLE